MARICLLRLAEAGETAIGLLRRILEVFFQNQRVQWAGFLRAHAALTMITCRSTPKRCVAFILFMPRLISLLEISSLHQFDGVFCLEFVGRLFVMVKVGMIQILGSLFSLGTLSPHSGWLPMYTEQQTLQTLF